MSQVSIHARFLSGGGQVLWPLRLYWRREKISKLFIWFPYGILGIYFLIIFRILISQGFLKTCPHPRICLLISRERKEGRERGKRQCDRETLIGCFLTYPNQDQTLNLLGMCSTGNWPQPFGVPDDAPTHWATGVHKLQKYRYTFYDSVLNHGWPSSKDLP